MAKRHRFHIYRFDPDAPRPRNSIRLGGCLARSAPDAVGIAWERYGGVDGNIFVRENKYRLPRELLIGEDE